MICPGGGLGFAALAMIAVVRAFVKSGKQRCLVTFILVALMTTSAVTLAYYYSSPRVMFRDYVADPMPPSVQILHSEYQGGRDTAVYLHFALTPEDLEAILAKRTYVTAESENGPQGGHPAWWAPLSLENPTVHYWEASPRSPGSAAWLWVNEARTEAYFTHWNF